MFVSFVRKFTQGLDLSYEQLNALSTAMGGLLARIVGRNEALRKENMFQNHATAALQEETKNNPFHSAGGIYASLCHSALCLLLLWKSVGGLLLFQHRKAPRRVVRRRKKLSWQKRHFAAGQTSLHIFPTSVLSSFLHDCTSIGILCSQRQPQ